MRINTSRVEDGMRYPSIDKLVEVTHSEYKLIVACAKRAKQLNHDPEAKVKPNAIFLLVPPDKVLISLLVSIIPNLDKILLNSISSNFLFSNNTLLIYSSIVISKGISISCDI